MQVIRSLMFRYLLTPETESEPTTHPGWSYAPLIAFAVSFWPVVFIIVDGLSRNFFDFFGFFVFLSGPNAAFAGLFFVTRWKLTKAIEQRLPVRSIKAAMWSSLILMGIVASILYQFPWILSMVYSEKGDDGLAWAMILGNLLILQFVVMPLVGVYGWFKGRGFYPDDPVKVEEDNTALDAIVERWNSKQG
jgi:hypothetical protein